MSYNGHANWETWNVSLWLLNDQGLYNLARRYRNRGYKRLLQDLQELGMIETPDGAKYEDDDIEEMDKVLEEL